MRAMMKKISGASDRKKHRIYAVIAVEILALILVLITSTGVYAAKDYWTVEGGDKTLATLTSKAEAEKAIRLIQQNYTKKGAKNVKVKLNPALSVKQKFYGKFDRKPKVSSAEETAAAVTVKKDGENPVVDVITKQTVAKKYKVDYKTVYKESSEAALNTTAVKSEGKSGVKAQTVTSTSLNGDVVDSEVVSSKTVEEAVDKVVLRGTGTREAAKGETTTSLGAQYSRESGEALVKYARQFLGNPYVYGGSSLTKGCDCSGFVMALYAHYGIQLPHDAGADRVYGRGVSLAEAQPGDLICFYGHIGIYIGNNQIIHAMNEQNGITISTIGYNGKKVLTVRRIFG